VAPPLQGGALCQEGRRERSAAGGACWELHDPGAGGSIGSVHPGPTHLVEQRVARRLVLPTQRRRLPSELLRLGPDVLEGELAIQHRQGRQAKTAAAPRCVKEALLARADRGHGGRGFPLSEGPPIDAASTSVG
jgi:hypothetical protein